MNKFIEKLGGSAKKILGLVIWLLIVLLAASTVRNIGKVGRIRNAVQSEKDRLAKLQRERDDLQAEIAKSQGAEFLEKQIRDKLGLARSDEAVVILPDAETLKKLAPPAPVEEDTLPDPNWKRWMKLFI